MGTWYRQRKHTISSKIAKIALFDGDTDKILLITLKKTVYSATKSHLDLEGPLFGITVSAMDLEIFTVEVSGFVISFKNRF